jgi:hypothetical protein
VAATGCRSSGGDILGASGPPAAHGRVLEAGRLSAGSPDSSADLGGVGAFWAAHGLEEHSQIHVSVLNLEPHPAVLPQVSALVGDARSLAAWSDQSVDVVFSNSLLEHVPDAKDRQHLASEIRRVGRNYFIQTPNHSFPLEPHYLVPGIQFLPEVWRASLVQHVTLGWVSRAPDRDQALHVVRSIRLLTRREMQRLFPGARLWCERFLGLTKSFVAIGGEWRDNR